MSQIPYADSNGHLSVEVELNYAANVFLVDSINYQRYTSGQQYTYLCGHYTKSPIRISVQGSGRWYLIVDDGDSGQQYKYHFY
jgi:hypothetical protein